MYSFICFVVAQPHIQDLQKMSGAHELNRKRQPPKMFVLTTDLKVQDQLDGVIRLQRGVLCQEQDRTRGDSLWVKVHIFIFLHDRIEKIMVLLMPCERQWN